LITHLCEVTDADHPDITFGLHPFVGRLVLQTVGNCLRLRTTRCEDIMTTPRTKSVTCGVPIVVSRRSLRDLAPPLIRFGKRPYRSKVPEASTDRSCTLGSNVSVRRRSHRRRRERIHGHRMRSIPTPIVAIVSLGSVRTRRHQALEGSAVALHTESEGSGHFGGSCSHRHACR